ncbi:DMT family transporter [Nioella sediminis]|jgi:drug/metabolite transporter (DMT)-like permease|uniref:DMT family transporter n=1 Tax=Nioella sediminis TaxID=1912092 RepID=UPI0008FCF95A|nr:DMT family transporter [Nioella sediminis]TBX16457.1 multidrug transporter [Roseovarius sp. JS7-11]
MERKTSLDMFGILSLTGFAVLLGVNQVAIKLGNGGFQPVFMAGIRSLGALCVLLLWMRLRGVEFRIRPGTVPSGILLGVLFAIEFSCIFFALDLTTVARTSILFYTMPVWLGFAGHFLLEGERLSPMKLAGQGLAVLGVAIAVLDRGGPGEASLLGDALALLAAMCWAGIALLARGAPVSKTRPEMQLFWQLAISAPLLLILSLWFGPFIRDFEIYHLGLLIFQIVCIASLGFLFWFWLLSIYPASSVASFSFLTPILGVILGWALLREELGASIIMSLTLVCLGLILINRPAKDRPR